VVACSHGGRALELRNRRGDHYFPDGSAGTHAVRSPCPRAGSSLPLSLLLVARGMRGGSHGTDVHHGVDARTPRMMKKPFLARLMSKWSYDISTGTATRAGHCGSLLEGLRSLGLELRRKHSGHEDLHGLGRRSVIPYVQCDDCCIVVCAVQAFS
jgi:hypothetical protein